MAKSVSLRGSEIRSLLGAHSEFNANNTFRGFDCHGYVSNKGLLDSEHKEMLNNDQGNITFVVYSYDTPIAWVLFDSTVRNVTQKFSVTTSRHQSLVRAYL